MFSNLSAEKIPIKKNHLHHFCRVHHVRFMVVSLCGLRADGYSCCRVDGPQCISTATLWFIVMCKVSWYRVGKGKMFFKIKQFSQRYKLDLIIYNVVSTYEACINKMMGKKDALNISLMIWEQNKRALFVACTFSSFCSIVHDESSCTWQSCQDSAQLYTSCSNIVEVAIYTLTNGAESV